MKQRQALACAALALPMSLTAQTRTIPMKIRLKLDDGRALLATVDDSKTARDFLSLLPLSLSLNDYNQTEKISDLPRRLTTEGAPAAMTPRIGDIAYYAPWGNLAIFYRDFGHSPGLIKLAALDGSAEALGRPGVLPVSIELLAAQGQKP